MGVGVIGKGPLDGNGIPGGVQLFYNHRSKAGREQGEISSPVLFCP